MTDIERSAKAAVAADTGRTEAFSDGVLAIAITLLVLNLAVPAIRPGDLGSALLKLWPAYVSFLASFLYIAVIWLNHHAAFRRIRSVDRLLIWANMGVLLGAVVLPFPTAVLANAFGAGNRTDEQAAVALYASVAMFMAATWLVFFHSLHRRSHLAHESVDPQVFKTERYRAIPGVCGYALAGLLGVLILPAIGLALFVLLPVFYALTSEGLRRPRVVISTSERLP
ncbi:MAG TPA: TMEM175 family protein [Candidatus Dormibacteraeota bacterium]